MTKQTDGSSGVDGPWPGDDALAGRLERVPDLADFICGDDEHRREPLIERGEARGLARAKAERAYDLAVEERLPPGCGVAVAAAGVSVQPLESAPPDVGTASPGEPAWVDPPPPDREAAAERRLRQTLRRVRSHLEATGSPGAALRALAAEADLERFDY
jgi:hypothetical protein